MGRFLKSEIAPGSRLRVVSPYFTIHAHKELREELKQAGECRFLFGDPESVDKLDKGRRPESAFKLDEGGIIPSEALLMKDAAIDCAQWVNRDDVLIHSVTRSGFLHGKMYHIEPPNREACAISGSSNFTYSGLGFGLFGNLELNTVAESEVRDGLRNWFDVLWGNKDRVRDVKKDSGGVATPDHGAVGSSSTIKRCSTFLRNCWNCGWMASSHSSLRHEHLAGALRISAARRQGSH